MRDREAVSPTLVTLVVIKRPWRGDKKLITDKIELIYFLVLLARSNWQVRELPRVQLKFYRSIKEKHARKRGK